jgi:hypothetical protein
MLALILLDLTLREIVADLPHDAGSIVIYVLFALFAGFIWAGSRGGSSGGPGAPAGRKDVR